MNVNKKISLAVMILLMVSGVVFGQATQLPIGDDRANPALCEELVKFSVYAENELRFTSDFGTPNSGKVGMNTLNAVGWKFDIQTKDSVYIGSSANGSCGSINKLNNSNVYCNNWSLANSAIAKTPIFEPKVPQLPDLSSVTFAGGSNISSGGPYLPNSYGNLNTTGNVTLTAGVYYFNAITLGGSTKIIIAPDASGSYKTVIYVDNNITINGYAASIIPEDVNNGTPIEKSKGLGQILFLVKNGDVIHGGGSGAAINMFGSFIAPNGTINVSSSGMKLAGQIAAKNILFSSGFQGGAGIIYIPYEPIEATITIEAEDRIIEREQCVAKAAYTVQIPAVLKSSEPLTGILTINYKIKGIAKSFTINAGAGETTANIPVDVPATAGDGTYYPKEEIIIEFDEDNYTYTGEEELEISFPDNPITITIQMKDDEQKKPEKPKFEQKQYLTSGKYGIIENYAGLVEQVAGTLSPTKTSNGNPVAYSIHSVVSPAGVAADWFTIGGNEIKTVPGKYKADYEIAAQREIVLAVRGNAALNASCVQQGDTSHIKINILPWNDSAFVTKNVTKSIAERGNVGIAVSDWFVRDGDQLTADNKKRVVSYKNGPTVTGATVTISSDGQTVTYSQAGVTQKVCQLTDNFTITVRDSAAYGYPTDTFDKDVVVTVNITPGNFFNPEPQLQQIELCKYDTRTISSVMVIDNDNCNRIPVSSNSFTGTPTTDLATDGSSVSIVDGKLVYQAPTNLNFTADPTKYQDTIRYTVTDGVNTGNGKIAVKINPVKDKKPTGDNIEITAVLGTPREVTVSDLANWTNNNFPLSANLVVQWNTGDIYTLNPTAAGFDVQLLDPVTGKFVITSPAGSTDETSRIFKYVIIDTQASDCSAFDRNTVSDSIIVKINFEKPKETAVIPENGIIIAIQNRDTTKLFDDITESLWDLVPTNEKGYFVTEVKIGDYTPLQGSIDIQPDGKFTYSPGLGFATTDRFSYKALSNAGDWSQIDGNIKTYINLKNLNEPDLGDGKVDTVNALETKNISVIDNSDSDKDILTILKLYKTKNPTVDNSNAEVSIVGDSSIVFKYLDKELTDTIDVEVTFWVNDSVNYTEYLYNDDMLDSTRYTEFDSYPNTVIVTVLPNAKAVNDSMAVKEQQSTNEFVETDGTKYFKVTDNDLFLENVKSYRVALKDSTTAGKIELNSDGTAVYTHEDSEKLYDAFSYYLISTLSDDSEDTTVGLVVISVSAKAPSYDGISFYEDKNADGIVDTVTILFDREVNDLENTEFDVIFGADTSLNVKCVYAKNADDTDNKKMIVLTGFKAAENKTSGVMEIHVTHKNFPDEAVQKINPEDRAAPVIKGAVYTQVSGGKDTVLLTMSELSEVKYDKTIPAFLFVVAQNIVFDDIIDNENGTFVVILSKESSGKVVSDDSIFVNVAANVKDIVAGAAKNVQDNPANKRIPIKINVITKIVSATYFDTSAVKDGYIDLIRIDLGTAITQEIADGFAKSFVLSPTRIFTKGAVTLNAAKTGFDLSVIETKRANGPNTGLFEDDLVSLATLITLNDVTIQAGNVKVKDSVAPVIIYAEYTPANSILDILFSEEVKAENGNAYKFWDTDPGKEFGMTFTAPEKPENISGNILRYGVNETGIPYPVAGDSIWVVKGAIVGDAIGNIQALSVRAPLKLNGKYDNGLEVFVVPNPLFMVKTGKGHEPKELPKSLTDYYEIPQEYGKGVALIVEAKGPITKLYNMSGFIKILDQTGNAVTEELPLKPVLTKHGMNAVAVWGGKNNSGRNVGAGSYLALIQVQVKFDDRDAPETFIFQKVILVTTASETSIKK